MYNHIEKLKKIQLFSKLENKDLARLLGHSKITEFKKLETIFLKDQELQASYLVLEGLVKSFSVNENGEESVIKIIETGEFISDPFSDLAAFSAQCLENSLIISIANKELKNLLKENNLLALDFLNYFLLQNRFLTNQIIQLKLASADERVGQFLLDCSIKDGEKIKHPNLKIEKSLIASYLGIRPETFSRVLKKLEHSQEISIEKKQISIAKKNSLCKYCNSDIAKRCNSRGEDFCEA